MEVTKGTCLGTNLALSKRCVAGELGSGSGGMSEGCSPTPAQSLEGREQRRWRTAGGSITHPKLLFHTLSLSCQFIANVHFPAATKSHFIEEFLLSSAAKPSVSLPGPGDLPAVHKKYLSWR